MKIVYLANGFGHISGPLCDELYKIYGDDFVFVATDALSEERRNVGSAAERDFVFPSKGNEAEAKRICEEADVLILGAAPIDFIEDRIKNNKFTIYYSERLFKNGYYRYFNPITMGRVRKRFINPSKNSNFYLLCASSFAPLDFNRIGAFKNKMYKWGYQPLAFEKDIDKLLEQKAEDGLDFIWVGRLVKLKHCDDAIRVIAELNKMGYPARMKIIGTGDEEENLKKLCSDLNMDDRITFLGSCNIDKTREYMDDANIFMFTSDFGEGWGVTLNECMNSGVACVASHAAGATNFLVKDGENALVYRSGDVKMLIDRVKFLIDNKEERERIARNGYHTVYDEWNTEFSHKRLLALIEELQKKGTCDLFESGPCSKAAVVKPNWFKKGK